MGSVSRTSQFAAVFKVLKKHYQPVAPNVDRPVLEQLLLACCLENAPYEAAEESLAATLETFFDKNEIRVTTIAELAEVMAVLPDPRAAANRLKRVLQSVFEDTYAFDLEHWRKKNLGPTVKWLQKLDGTTNFSVAYVVQSALGGHAIPVDSGALGALRVVELVTDKDVKQGVVPGLERAISKSKGIEFGSLLHQLGADFTANPYSPNLRKTLLQIDPDCKDRLPKRRGGRKKKTSRPDESGETAPGGREPVAGGAKQGRAKKTAAAKEEAASAPQGKSASTGKKTASTKGNTKGKADEAKSPRHDDSPKRSAAEGLSKRKPR